MQCNKCSKPLCVLLMIRTNMLSTKQKGDNCIKISDVMKTTNPKREASNAHRLKTVSNVYD
jgi:hypothetical protein